MRQVALCFALFLLVVFFSATASPAFGAGSEDPTPIPELADTGLDDNTAAVIIMGLFLLFGGWIGYMRGGRDGFA